MTHSRRLSLIAALFASALPLAGHAADPAHPSGLRVASRIAGPDGGWDLASFDPARRRVYIAHGDEVISIDTDSGKANMAFAPGDHLHGIIAVPGTGVLVASNSGDNTARLFSADDGKLLA